MVNLEYILKLSLILSERGFISDKMEIRYQLPKDEFNSLNFELMTKYKGNFIMNPDIIDIKISGIKFLITKS
jgi:hypothetical protein